MMETAYTIVYFQEHRTMECDWTTVLKDCLEAVMGVLEGEQN